MQQEMSYFPGCSLATSAHENNQTLISFCREIGISLIELEDWNCCGSSSAHSIRSELAFDLPSRNLSLASPKRQLMIACPGCLLKMREAQFHLMHDEKARLRYESLWGKPPNDDLEIIHFFDLLGKQLKAVEKKSKGLNGLCFVFYYGCMLANPPQLRSHKNYYGVMEKLLSSLGATALNWGYASRCCGTFLSAARPDIVAPIVNQIMNNAIDSGAECIITACAMCHLNLELRCTIRNPIPILHFSQILSLAIGISPQKDWFSRHLIDPRPALINRNLISE